MYVYIYIQESERGVEMLHTLWGSGKRRVVTRRRQCVGEGKKKNKKITYKNSRCREKLVVAGEGELTFKGDRMLNCKKKEVRS